MNLQEIEQLIQLCQKSGVSRLKTKEISLRFEALPVKKVVEEPIQRAIQIKADDRPLGDLLPQDEDIVHHLNEVKSILKLSDEELVDKLFPDQVAEA